MSTIVRANAAAVAAMVGNRFHDLTVVAVAPERLHRQLAVVCRCECGGQKTAQARYVLRGTTKSCGCWQRRAKPRNGRMRNIVGTRFDRWIVIEKLPWSKNPRVRVRCDCGVEKVVFASNLLNHSSGSCGCLARDSAREIHTTHGLSKHPLYATWVLIHERCDDPACGSYSNYGGRGITVCAGWSGDASHGFANFIRDMGEKPSPKHSVDRRDNDGGYWCGRCEECVSLGRVANCRWATQSEQMTNTRRTVFVEIDGAPVLASVVCAAHGISRQLFHARVRNGWDATKAATQLPRESTGTLRDRPKWQRQAISRMGHEAMKTVKRTSLRAIIDERRARVEAGLDPIVRPTVVRIACVDAEVRCEGGERTPVEIASANGIAPSVFYSRVRVLGWDEARAMNTPTRRKARNHTAARSA